MKISLRSKLTLLYTAIMALSLTAFGVYTYISICNELYSNLDRSLNKVVTTLEHIIEQNHQKAKIINSKSSENIKEEFGMDRFSMFHDCDKNLIIDTAENKLKNEDAFPDIVWSAVYEHILLDPKNYTIQISDTNNNLIWRSKNLTKDTLPILSISDNSKGKISSSNSNIKTSKLIHTKGTILANVSISKREIRLCENRTKNEIISVGYSISHIKSTLSKLFYLLLLAGPIILLISSIIGLLISKLSLRPIDEIIKSSKAITAHNLSKRLVETGTKDEIGRLTETLNDMIKRLEDSFNQIKQFTTDASHELRTPLTILRGELEITLHSRKSSDEYEGIITSALEEVIRLSNMVETMFELSRADRGHIEMNYTERNLSQLIMDISDDVEILSESKGVTVKSSITPNLNMYYDTGRIHQAFLNLVDNAIKYTPSGGEINIELKKENDFAVISISDTGIGIPEEQLPHIFDRFYRADLSRSGDINGIGLGLAIVKWIVDAHNGRIEVNSQKDKGTTFSIYLPFVQDEK